MKKAWVVLLFMAQAAGAGELEGWWVAEARHAGQSTPVYLHFTRHEGKPAARMSLPVLDAWDFAIGPFKASAEKVELTGVNWTLVRDARSHALNGVLPPALVPVHEIPVTFRKVKAPAIPTPPDWSKYPRPKVLWSREAGGPVWAGLALDTDERTLLVGNDAGAVLALDAEDGAHRWTLQTGGKVRATPTVTNAHVYAVSDDGHAYKLDKRTGRVAWKSRIDTSDVPRVPSFEPKSKFDRYASSAIERDGRVYVGGRDGGVSALDAASGKTLWRFATGDLVMGTPTVRGDLLLVGSFDKHVYALDAASGALRWKRDLGGVVPADVVVMDGRALVGTRAYDFIALDLHTGTPLWDEYVWFSWIESVPVVRKGHAYVGSSDALRLFAFDVGSGARTWETRIPGYGWSKPALVGDAVVIGTVGTAGGLGPRDGAILSAACKDGSIRWLHRAVKPDGAREWGFASSVVAGPQRRGRRAVVYAADLQGRIFALTDSGTES